MSEKSKARRARREAQQEKQAKRVITWIIVGLLVIAVVGYVAFMMN